MKSADPLHNLAVDFVFRPDRPHPTEQCDEPVSMRHRSFKVANIIWRAVQAGTSI